MDSPKSVACPWRCQQTRSFLLEVHAHNDKQVASLHSHNDCLDELRGITLGVVLLGHVEVEEQATASDLHENMH
jgi:hypothetical protein